MLNLYAVKACGTHASRAVSKP